MELGLSGHSGSKPWFHLGFFFGSEPWFFGSKPWLLVQHPGYLVIATQLLGSIWVLF